MCMCMCDYKIAVFNVFEITTLYLFLIDTEEVMGKFYNSMKEGKEKVMRPSDCIM